MGNTAQVSAVLNTRQVSTVCRGIYARTRLRNLSIGLNDLSEVSLDILTLAVNRLERLSLVSSGLTGQQVTLILTEVLAQSSLRELVLGEQAALAPELVTQARRKCEVL